MICETFLIRSMWIIKLKMLSILKKFKKDRRARKLAYRDNCQKIYPISSKYVHSIKLGPSELPTDECYHATSSNDNEGISPSFPPCKKWSIYKYYHQSALLLRWAFTCTNTLVFLLVQQVLLVNASYICLMSLLDIIHNSQYSIQLVYNTEITKFIVSAFAKWMVRANTSTGITNRYRNFNNQRTAQSEAKML